jgi:hypothetical protein
MLDACARLGDALVAPLLRLGQRLVLAALAPVGTVRVLLGFNSSSRDAAPASRAGLFFDAPAG